jgi:branched-chain amino acid transport system ATP-binding protein
MLSVQALRANYGPIPILMGIDFTLADGEYLGILGHNGMGKTTLLRTLMGYLKATGGTIAFDGRDITRLATHERALRGIGLVPQGREIFPNLSVQENLRMGLAGAKKEMLSVIDDVLTEFPRLKPLLDRQGGTLSGGEQQLLALARCLCAKPRLILLDEPTEGIQPSIIEEIIETLLRIRQSHRLAIILVEQNLEFITSLSERVLTIQKGRITGEIAGDALKDSEAMAHYAGAAMS